jgi:NAD+ synthase
MAETLKLGLAQLDAHVGAIRHNLEHIREARAAAARGGADLVVTPEFSIAGYPPEGLVRNPAFLAACEEAIAALAAETADGGPGLVLGGPWREADKLYNGAFVLDAGRILARRAKHELPNGGGFDEQRLFDAGPAPGPVAFRGVRLGLMVCEDWWFPDVAETLAESGAELLLSINASAFEVGKPAERLQRAVGRVVETGLPFVFCAQVGGQDELVFDGAGFVLNADRSLAVQMPYFEEALALTAWRRDGERLVCEPQPLSPEPDRLDLIYRGLMRGLADYVRKQRFPGVILGLSGGIGSALAAALAADALGPERVRGIVLPGPSTSQASRDDAAECARLLGLRCDVIPIAAALETLGNALWPVLAARPSCTTEPNLQSRTRGLILMALSDALGDMLLSTVTKSDMAVGTTTLCGDMCGGFAVLKDVYSSTARALARWRNGNRPPGALGSAGPVVPERVIAERVIAEPPSAERRPAQTDQDMLPPHEVLDAILEGLIEREEGVDALVAGGHDLATVLRVRRRLDRAEYKRRQAPPGVTVSQRAFGRDRRTPITNGFTELVQ